MASMFAQWSVKLPSDVLRERTCAPKAPLVGGRRAGGRHVSMAAPGSSAASTPQQQDAASFDVSGAVVQPAYRQRPWEAEAVDAASAAAVRIAFVSEAGICRCVLAAAAFRAALAARAPHLAGSVECGCRATRDFCAGEGPAPAAAAAAAELGLALPQRYEAEVFRDSRDIVYFDVVLVMDKFTAADVLREVSVFDTIKTWGRAGYSSKVRRLGEFSAALAAAPVAARDPDAADIEDALYGNVGGEEEEAAVRSAAAAIQASCQGLVDFLVQVEQQQQQRQQQQQQQQQQQEQQEEELQGAADGSPREQTDGGGGGPRLGDALTAAVREMEAMDWLVPPMLQPR